MTSLEWVNAQIKECKKTIDDLKNRIIEDSKYPSLVNEHNEQIRIVNDVMKNFENIKIELEAWKETQKYLILNEKHIPFYESTYEYLTLKNDCIDESNSTEEGISLTIIKKALEIENE